MSTDEKDLWQNPMDVDVGQIWRGSSTTLPLLLERIRDVEGEKVATFRRASDAGLFDCVITSLFFARWQCIGLQCIDGQRVMVGDRFRRADNDPHMVKSISIGQSVWLHRKRGGVFAWSMWTVNDLLGADYGWTREEPSPGAVEPCATQFRDVAVSGRVKLDQASPFAIHYSPLDTNLLRRLIARLSSMQSFGIVTRRRLASVLHRLADAVEHAPTGLSARVNAEVAALVGWLAVLAEREGMVSEEQERWEVEDVERRVGQVVELVKSGRRGDELPRR